MRSYLYPALRPSFVTVLHPAKILKAEVCVRMASVRTPSSSRSPGVSQMGSAVRSPIGSLRSPSGVGRASSVETVDPRVLLFRCRKEGDSRVIDVAIQAGVSFHRFAERLSNEFGKQVPEFSFFSTEDRKEVHVADEAAFGKCKTEMLAPPPADQAEGSQSAGNDDGDRAPEYCLDITVKVQAAGLHVAPAQRSAEQNAAIRKERNEARLARKKDLEQVCFLSLKVLCLFAESCHS